MSILTAGCTLGGVVYFLPFWHTWAGEEVGSRERDPAELEWDGSSYQGSDLIGPTERGESEILGFVSRGGSWSCGGLVKGGWLRWGSGSCWVTWGLEVLPGYGGPGSCQDMWGL